MGTILGPKDPPKYREGSKNEVLGITEVKTYAVNRTNSDSKEETLLVMVFGKMEDGGPGVFVLAEADAMRKQLTIANEGLRKQVRTRLAGDVPIEAASLPATPELQQ